MNIAILGPECTRNMGPRVRGRAKPSGTSSVQPADSSTGDAATLHKVRTYAGHRRVESSGQVLPESP
jgi:hypothetical protein